MRFVSFSQEKRLGLAVAKKGSEEFHGCWAGDPAYPGALSDLIGQGTEALSKAAEKLLAAPRGGA